MGTLELRFRIGIFASTFALLMAPDSQAQEPAPLVAADSIVLHDPAAPKPATAPEAASAEAVQTLALRPAEVELKKVDEALQGCAQEATPRVRAALSLGLLETRLEELLGAIASRTRAEANLSDSDLAALIQEADRQGTVLIKESLSEDNPGSEVLRAFRRTDALRLQADFQLRLAVFAASLKSNDKGTGDEDTYSKQLAGAAQRTFHQALNEFGNLPDAQRAREIPGLLGKMTETRLSLEQFRHMRTPGESTEVALDRMNTAIEEMRKRFLGRDADGKVDKAFAADQLEIDLLEAQNFFSLATSAPGQAHATVSASQAQFRRVNEVIAGLSSAEPAITSGPLPQASRKRLTDSVSTVRGLAPFYLGKHSQNDAHVEALLRNLKSTDPLTRSTAGEVAQNLLEHQPDSYAAATLIYQRKNLGTLHPQLQLEQRAQFQAERAATYNQKMSESLGAKQADLFRLPTYSELVASPDGSLRILQERYFDRLNELAKLKERYDQDPKGVPTEDIENALRSADLEWVQLQCVKQATGRSSDNQLRRKTPSGIFRIDLSPCRSAKVTVVAQPRGKRPVLKSEPRKGTLSDTLGVASQVTDSAISRNTNTEIAWIVAPQVVITLASGGTAALVELTAVKLGAGELIAAATQALVARGMSRALVNLSMRAATASAKTANLHLSSESSNAVGAFAIQGLRDGHWDTHTLKENFAYTSSQTDKGAQVARVVATAVASSGLGKLWKVSSQHQLAQKVSAKVEQGRLLSLTANVGSKTFLGGLSSGAGEAAYSVIAKRQVPVHDMLHTFTDPKTWVSSIPVVGSILSPPERLFSPAALLQLSSLPLEAEDEASFKPVQTCAEKIPAPKAP